MARFNVDHPKQSLGVEAKTLRISQNLTQQELADMAGVSMEDVNLLENSLPLRLNVKLKILGKLWTRI